MVARCNQAWGKNNKVRHDTVLLRHREQDHLLTGYLKLSDLTPSRLLLCTSFAYQGCQREIVFVNEFQPFRPRSGAAARVVPPDSTTCPRFFLPDRIGDSVVRCYDIRRVVGVAMMVPDWPERAGVHMGEFNMCSMFHLNRFALGWQ
jgi:hypothetical protein